MTLSNATPKSSERGVIYRILARLGFLKDDRLLGDTLVLALARGETGGLLKRIDENRELLETLRARCPTFLHENWWVEGWVASNDRFFTTLQGILGIPDACRPQSRPYPRLWPLPLPAQPVDELAVLREVIEMLGFDSHSLVRSLMSEEERPQVIRKIEQLAASGAGVTRERWGR